MGKRSSFERVPRDFYPTPYEAVVPLLPHLREGTVFCEPCGGDGALIHHLERNGHHCWLAWDIQPRGSGISVGDALIELASGGDLYITNPPWSRDILHPLIAHLSAHKPTWLLFDADWMHTRQSAPFMPYLRKIVSVGRVKWIPDSPFTGKDNCCWYLFDQTSDAPAQFVGRAA
jgi:hypothetical protein